MKSWSLLPGVFILIAWSTSQGFAQGLDARRGAEVVERQRCLQCHNVRGVGNRTAPDLSKLDVDEFTPTGLTAEIWNHMPLMRFEMTPRIEQPGPTAAESQDLFAYLYSLAHFDVAGDARRGERVFRDRQCGSCHGAIPSEWRLADRFALVQGLWNHAGAMERSRAQQNATWPMMTGRDIADLAAYIVREQRLGNTRVAFPAAAVGEPLFKDNCGGCHPSILPLRDRLKNKTLGDIAAGMWNHLPKMQRVPLIAENDLNAIVGYVWEQSLDRQGNAGRGRRVFEEKRCEACHADYFRGERVLTPYSLMSAAWRHDPLSARYEGRRWPTLSSQDVADLVAYLNSRP